MARTDAEAASILIVDDNSWMQRILAKILLSYGLKAHFASNAFEALNIAVDEKPEAIILDIVMPEINGLQTLRLLKSISCTRAIPVLMITAAPDPKTLGQAVSFGADGFIHKPFTRASIHDKLVQVLSPDLLPSEHHQQHSPSDAELDSLLGTDATTAYLRTPSQQASDPGSLHVQPKHDDAADKNEHSKTPKTPEFSVTHRRLNTGLRRASAEMPDEAELRELLKRTNRR